MTRTRTKAGLAALGAVAAIAIIGPAQTGATCTSGSGGTGGISQRTCTSKGYINPFKHRAWYAGRIDMGVDYMPIKRKRWVRAIGDAKVVMVDRHSGWPGGKYMVYKLLDGDHAGKRIFVAETLTKLVRRGKRVDAGERIATALPGGTGLEIGWATKSGQPRAATCYSEGMKTHSGRTFAKFLRSLGAQVGDRPRVSSTFPTGKRC